MALPRFLPLLHRAAWEFWVPLPLVAALFWTTGNFIATQILSRPFNSVHKLQADRQLNRRLPVTILSINAEIDRSLGVTTIFVNTSDSTLKKLEYEFPVTQTSQVEAAIAQELAMPIENVRKLISYRMKH
ncbi:hypothetical protein QUA70_02435 [Microcoleus sp. LAD1_D5]|uniref:hypothetical protein n=1 Tax=unclassified Microcoleus TaxID=2642155 RepID=UPI002FD6AD1B